MNPLFSENKTLSQANTPHASSDENTLIGLVDTCWILIAVLLVSLALSQQTKISYEFDAIPDNARIFYRDGNQLWEYRQQQWHTTQLRQPLFALECGQCRLPDTALLAASHRNPLIIGFPAATEQAIAAAYFANCQRGCDQFRVHFTRSGFTIQSS